MAPGATSRGRVEHVNPVRGTLCVRVDDGSYGYFRVRGEPLPTRGGWVEWPATEDGVPKTLVEVDNGRRSLHVASALLGLPPDIALNLAQ